MEHQVKASLHMKSHLNNFKIFIVSVNLLLSNWLN